MMMPDSIDISSGSSKASIYFAGYSGPVLGAQFEHFIAEAHSTRRLSLALHVDLKQDAQGSGSQRPTAINTHCHVHLSTCTQLTTQLSIPVRDFSLQ